MSWILLLTRKIESHRTCREEKTPAYIFSYVYFPEMFSVCTDLLTYLSRRVCDVSYVGTDVWPLVSELWHVLSFKVVGLLWFLNAITFSLRGPRFTCHLWPLTSQSWFDPSNYCAPLHATGVASTTVGAAARPAAALGPPPLLSSKCSLWQRVVFSRISRNPVVRTFSNQGNLPDATCTPL